MNQIAAEQRRCKKCAAEKPLDDFYVHRKKDCPPWRSHTCKRCHNSQTVAWASANPKRVRQHRHRTKLKQKYGISGEEYAEMLSSQGGKCKICRAEPVRRRLDVDHCHDTGAVRGLLCEMCNKGLGSFRDDVSLMQKAIRYLESA